MKWYENGFVQLFVLIVAQAILYPVLQYVEASWVWFLLPGIMSGLSLFLIGKGLLYSVENAYKRVQKYGDYERFVFLFAGIALFISIVVLVIYFNNVS